MGLGLKRLGWYPVSEHEHFITYNSVQINIESYRVWDYLSNYRCRHRNDAGPALGPLAPWLEPLEPLQQRTVYLWGEVTEQSIKVRWGIGQLLFKTIIQYKPQ
jgi:hypothetical protein